MRIAEKLKKGERPDRVYGLRQTRNIENLMFDEVDRMFHEDPDLIGKQVNEIVDQPLSQVGDPILFPFLVLEAKSSSAGDSWHAIQMQTAFSIKTLLDTQHRLHSVVGARSKWETGPLVWFLANRGEDWRISLAYTEAVRAKPRTVGTIEYVSPNFRLAIHSVIVLTLKKRIVDVWRGSILTRDGALQLLLLIGYIFDWARDAYRVNIIRELRVLASGSNDSASTVFADSDIYSTFSAGTVALDYIEERISSDAAEDADIPARDDFMKYDSRHGIIRHAAFVQSRYNGIIINKDNFPTLAKSTETGILKRFCREMFWHFGRATFLHASDLDAMEEQWTGARRRHGQDPRCKYLVVTSFTTYISNRWQILRELFTVAIALETWPDFVAAASNKLEDDPEMSVTREIPDSTHFLHALKSLRSGSPRQILLAAIRRRSLCIGTKRKGTISMKEGADYVPNMVNFVCSLFKKGSLEPQEPFIRRSERLDQQHRLANDAEPYFREPAEVSAEGYILIYATGRATAKERSNICHGVFLTTDCPQLPDLQELRASLRNVYETKDVYHTARTPVEPSKPVLRKRPEELWNLRNTYGIYNEGFEFLPMLEILGVTTPVTQGSSRAITESGRQLFERNMTPWSDDRLFPYQYNSRERTFILYKLLSRELSFWRSVAHDRRTKGLSCCECCSFPGYDHICEVCQAVLDDPRRLNWIKAHLMGRKPFDLKLLSESEIKDRVQYTNGIHRDSVVSAAPSRESRDTWALCLDFYPLLYEPFESIGELADQLKAFESFCRPWESNFIISLKRKRKRLETSSGPVKRRGRLGVTTTATS